MKRWIVIPLSLLAVAAAAGLAWRLWTRPGKVATYRTAKVERGDVVQIVRATGTVQPVKLVQVGTQVNGIVQKLYVDFNSRVKAKDIVAEIDPSVYRANLAQAEANVAHSQASADEARANLLKASNDLVRATGLAKRDLLSSADLDAAIANAASAEAQVKVALAGVLQTAAARDLSKANLSYTVIAAPVDGTVVSRNVDEGQTVVASMSAQTLFTIATDLRTILISASMPEADVGRIRAGQKVTFNVDAYPATFTGTVDQVRIASSTVQNVVTYPVMVRADNPNEKLFPGMTANISCVIDEHTRVLKVPNTALRFRPEKQDAAGRPGQPAAPSESANPTGGERSGEKKSRLFVRQPDGSLTPIRVTVGITDGTWSEVFGENLDEGMDVVTGVLENGAKAAVVNPFMPTPPTRQTRPPRL
jgi:HlyD family secretion protein